MRLSQRDILPKSIKNRLLGGIVLLGNDVSGSNVLAAGDTVLHTITTSMKDNPRVLALPDVTLYQDSVLTANRIPGGANVIMSDYEIIGPFNDWNDTDDFNVKTKVFIRNARSANTTFTSRIGVGTEDGYKEGGSWTTAGNILLGKGGSTNLSIRVAASLDDGNLAGSWFNNSSNVGFGKAAAGNNVITALRFNNVTIPQGLTITSATITLTADATDADVVNAKVFGIDEDDTADFTADPTGRTRTTASVDWDFNGVTLDVAYTSSSIITVIQEIINRAGWVSGNDMGFLIDDDGSALDKILRFYSYDGSTTKAALLDVTYTGTGSITAGLRFTNVTIPQGATIVSAKITFTATATDGDTVDTEIFGVDEDDTASFSSDPTGRAQTTASAFWDIAGTTAEAEYDTSSLTSVVQEIVDRAGWASGNDMGFLIEDDASTNGKQLTFYGYDSSTAKAPLLTIVYVDVSGNSRTILIRAAPRGIVNVNSFV